VIDQLLMYDQAVLTWIQDNFPPLLEGRTTQLLIATQRKAFAEVTSGQIIDERTRKLPRISLQRLDPENDPTRFNSNRIRRLGWCNPTQDPQSHLLSSKFPAPVIIPYQIDMWTRFVKEMNLWERFIMETFSPSYTYLRIRPNDVWGWKMFSVFWEGAVINNSDLEPQEEERQIRKTININCECWMFPDDFIKRPVVKRVEMEWLDKDDSSLYDRSFMPPLETIAAGTGAQTAFSGTFSRPPVLRHTAVLQTVIGGATEIVHDDGNGGWVGDRVSGGSLDYVTGLWSITFSSPPDNGEDVTITYFTDQEAL